MFWVSTAVRWKWCFPIVRTVNSAEPCGFFRCHVFLRVWRVQHKVLRVLSWPITHLTSSNHIDIIIYNVITINPSEWTSINLANYVAPLCRMQAWFHVSTGRRPTTSNLESLQKRLDEDEEQIEERQCRDSLGEFVQGFMAWPAAGHKMFKKHNYGGNPFLHCWIWWVLLPEIKIMPSLDLPSGYPSPRNDCLCWPPDRQTLFPPMDKINSPNK